MITHACCSSRDAWPPLWSCLYHTPLHKKQLCWFAALPTCVCPYAGSLSSVPPW